MSIQKVISDIEMLLGVDDDDACDMFENYRSQILSTLGERRFKDMERRVYANSRKAVNFINPVITTTGEKPIMEIKSKVGRNAIANAGAIAAQNANSDYWIAEYKKEIKSTMQSLDAEASVAVQKIRDYGRIFRDEAKNRARTDKWQELNRLGAKFLPDLRKAANIIQGLRRDADAL